jgi:hypothetical protein
MLCGFSKGRCLLIGRLKRLAFRVPAGVSARLTDCEVVIRCRTSVGGQHYGIAEMFKRRGRSDRRGRV